MTKLVENTQHSSCRGGLKARLEARDQVGGQFSVTRERIGQIEAKALRSFLDS